MFNPVHPGEILKEEIINPLHLNMGKTAEHLAISRKHLSNICAGKNGITAPVSLKLEQAFGAPSAETWMRMQAKYDVWKEKQKNNVPVDPIPQACG